MASRIKTETDIEIPVDAIYETSQFAMGVGIVSAALIGIWATTCMASAILNNGIVDVIRSFFTAITGN